MPRKQPLNNRINKEAMFKKIMPSASADPLSIEEAVSSSAEGNPSKKSLGDDLIDLTVSSLEDGLIGIPSQRRVIATPAAPTAPVPPPPTIRIPSIRPPRKALENALQKEEPTVPASAAPDLHPQPELSSLAETEPSPAPNPQPEASPFPEPAASSGVQPEAVPMPLEASVPYWPSQPMWDYPAGQPQEIPFYPVQPYPPAQYPMGYYPYPPYPYPPYAQPPEAAIPEANQESGIPSIKESPNATVVADSASVVTDTVIIQGNTSSGAPAPSAAAPASAATEPPQPGISEVAEELDIEEDIPAPHPFQAEIDDGQSPVNLENQNALPPLSEGNGQVVNLIEQIAAPWIEEAVLRLHGCRCEKCLAEIASLTFNQLAPCYMLPEEMTEEALSNRRRVSETVRAIYAAAFQVKNAPPHSI